MGRFGPTTRRSSRSTRASAISIPRIEYFLWVRDTTAGASKYARKLLADVQALHQRPETLELRPARLANCAVELLDEVASSKITDEDR